MTSSLFRYIFLVFFSILSSKSSPIYLNPYPIYAKDYDVMNQQNICILIEQTYRDTTHENAGRKNATITNQLNSRCMLSLSMLC